MPLVIGDQGREEGPPAIVILGGGFCGTMLAVQLARWAAAGSVRILLIERGPRVARGLAYGTPCDRHLLNVPAGMMSALPDEPSHFLDWLRLRDPQAQAGTFALRRTYGDYLEELLISTARLSAVSVECLQDEALEYQARDDGGSTIVRMASGGCIRADRVVLALGNHPPLDPPAMGGSCPVRRYASDPWKPGPLQGLRVDESIALIGSGLTAVDVIVEADSLGHRGVINAISRHGLLPRRHLPAAPRPHFDLADRPATARTLLRAVRAEATNCQAEGGDWRSVVDGIRPVAQSLWRSLPNGERRRFVRHLASHWDAHRHRVAPQIDDLLQDRLRDGRLIVVAGRILASEERDDRVVLTVKRRGESRVETIVAGLVVNCTGPARDIRRSASPLLRSLIESGVARPGPLSLGLDVHDSGAVVRADGRPHDRLFAIGPLLKDQLWETTAVRELRVQAAELASRLLGQV